VECFIAQTSVINRHSQIIKAEEQNLVSMTILLSLCAGHSESHPLTMTSTTEAGYFGK